MTNNLNNQINLREVAKKYKKKLEQIKVFLVDVDGVLTNGQIYYSGEEVGFNRYFHTLDGFGLKVLQKAGIKVGVISGGKSLGLRKRMEDLKIEYAFLGDEDKRSSYLEILRLTGCSDHQVLYIGDELFDLPILKRVGFSVTVPHASEEIKEAVDYVTFREGGQGCVREVIDMVRYTQNIYPEIPDFSPSL